MTVQELINVLKKFRQDAKVVFIYDDFPFDMKASDIDELDENDYNSPIAIFVPNNF